MYRNFEIVADFGFLVADAMVSIYLQAIYFNSCTWHCVSFLDVAY